MYELLNTKQYDVIGCRRISRRGEPLIRTCLSNGFYWLLNNLSQTNIPSGVRNFRLMTRQVVDEIINLPKNNRFSKGLFAWLGFDTY